MKTRKELRDEKKEAISKLYDSVADNSMLSMTNEATTTKGDKVANVEDVTSKDAKVTNEKKISLSQAEKSVVSFIEKLIAKNTAVICNSLFSNEIAEEFERQISELRNDKQERNALILDNMKKGFFKVDSGANFIEFKANVSKFRSECIEEYKAVFEAEKLKEEKRKDIEAKISALGAVRSVIGETAYTNGVNALREQLAAI